MTTDRLYRVRLDADTFLADQREYYPHEISLRVYGAVTGAKYHQDDLLIPEAKWTATPGCMHLRCLLVHAAEALEIIRQQDAYAKLEAAGVIS